MTMADFGPFDIGDRLKVTGTFTVAGAATDPSAITVRIRKPDGTETSTAATDDPSAVGKWLHEFDVTMAGVWSVAMKGTGPATASEEVLVQVTPGGF
jgi:uncharacterized protein YfaS (alpha-2-macroglobulin family)